jgi:hypothetical protein
LVKYIINGNCVLRVKKRKQLSHSFICGDDAATSKER